MPQLNGKGPLGEGSGTGRKAGKCGHITGEEKEKVLGSGLAEKRKSGGGKGMGKRRKSHLP